MVYDVGPESGANLVITYIINHENQLQLSILNFKICDVTGYVSFNMNDIISDAPLLGEYEYVIGETSEWE